MIGTPGFTVLREIPADYLAGLASQIYSLHGGVIRDQSGRILAHLALPAATAPLQLVPGLNLIPELINGYQLHALSQEVSRVLSWSMASTALAGLGLATSLVSVVYLSKKVSQVEERVAAIKNWLGSASEGQLRAAVSDLTHAASATNGQMRHQLMLSAKTSFASLAYHYRTQAASATKLDDLEVLEDFAATAMIGAVLCASDLGLHEAAHRDMVTYHGAWSEMARAQARRLLLLDEAARLLDGRYVNALPASALVSVLDFAHKQTKGIDWIDQLRVGYGPGTALTSGIRTIDEQAIRYARRLCAREQVLSGYCSHFEFLAAKRLSSTDFASLVGEQIVGHAGPALVINTGA